MTYDFILKGGRVVDPSQGIDKVMDLYVKNGKIVDAPKDPSTAECNPNDVFDATGYLVTPGLIDFHTHMAWRRSDLGFCPELYGPCNGITAVVDAGTCGTGNFETMAKEIIPQSVLTMRAYMHVHPMGIPTEKVSEDLDPACFDRKRMGFMLENYGDVILGLKLRLGDRSRANGRDLSPLKDVIKIAEEFNQPICCHIVQPEHDIDESMDMMRPGDVVCHVLQGGNDHNFVDKNGKVRKSVREARERGVILDSAVGRVNHHFGVMESVFNDGFFPDIISTDLVTSSVYRVQSHSLLRCMATHESFGMPFMEVLRAVTETPAKVMKLEGKIGTLKTGALADVAVFKEIENPVVLYDRHGNSKECKHFLVPQLTLKEGMVAYCNIEYAMR